MCNLKKYDEALSVFNSAADIFKDLGDNISFGEQLGNIGSVHRDKGEWDLSLPSYLEAVKVFEKAGHNAGLAAQYSNISYTYSMKGLLQESLEYSVKAKDLYDKMGEEKMAEMTQENIEALKAAIKN
jgi:tetratricopeptide (TPR) repeat protein